MTSTTTSENTILSVNNLNLVYKLDYYHQTLRDKFVKLVTSPIETLTSSKDSLHVLKNLSLDLKKGDRVGLMGVNGAGKTTLARCISGMLVQIGRAHV